MLRRLRAFWRLVFGRRRSLTIVIILTIVAFATGFTSNYWLPLRLGYTLLFGICLSLLWSWSAGLGLRVRMSRSRDRVQAGEVIVERFEVINETRIPKLWLELEELSELPGHRARFVATLSPTGVGVRGGSRRSAGDAGSTTWVRSWCAAATRSTFFRASFGSASGVALVVYPQALELPRYSVPPANLPGEGRFRAAHALRDAERVGDSRVRAGATA